MLSKIEGNPLVLILFLLCGLVTGGLIGQYIGDFAHFEWLAYSMDFGIDKPFSIDLGVLRLSFEFMFSFNISGVIGLLLFVYLYKRFM